MHSTATLSTEPRVNQDEGQPDPAQLQRRIEKLERERRHLKATVEMLEGIAGSLHFVDILQSITTKLGELYGLDRCSIFLTERRGQTARLVASYEDPAIRNYLVDLGRYPELQRALQSGETVFIPDAAADPKLQHIRGAITERRAKSITVVPIAWRDTIIGAIFLRTFRDGQAFSENDLQFFRRIGKLAGRALRNAYRFEQLEQQADKTADRARQAGLERIALIAFLERLLTAFGKRDGTFSSNMLSEAAVKELDRLTDVAMTVIGEEGKGR